MASLANVPHDLSQVIGGSPYMEQGQTQAGYKKLGSSVIWPFNLKPTSILISAMSSEASQDEESPSNNNEAYEQLLITDAPAEAASQDDKAQSVAVGTKGIQLDHLGPMTISRISNWDKLTEPERSRTIRLVTQRNAMRVQKLEDQPPQTDEQQTPAFNQEHPVQPTHNEL
ncbi:hypothetical protein VP01_24g4 [Puccinia sorghi]|uniref:Uncharacterized protein n=1 Tax=Puccinia sorghi TaxID=27349 RepID=A0A0L6V5P4_9BASI|nr:hypothetical protein VP01_24g4 [Puccinia sorghi]